MGGRMGLLMDSRSRHAIASRVVYTIQGYYDTRAHLKDSVAFPLLMVCGF